MKYLWLLGIAAIVACSAESSFGGGPGTGGSFPYGGTGGQDGEGTDAGSTTSDYQQGSFAGGTPGSGGNLPPGASGGASGSAATAGGVAPPPAPGQAGEWQAVIPTGGGGEGEDGDAGECGSVTVEADVEVTRHPGNLLIVFDRSGSMNDDWGGRPRYQAAGDALIAAITPMQDLLNVVGAVFFPSPPSDTSAPAPCNVADPLAWIPPNGACLNFFTGGMLEGSCEVNEIAAPDQISFRPAPEFISAFPTLWFLSEVAAMTPLEGGVNMADAAIAATTFEGAVAVVIMTDGAPNCNTVPANVNATVARWLANGISTYVVGLPGSAEASDLLNQLAATGGTGTYIEPNDPAALQAELEGIVTETIKSGLKSCEIALQQEEDADVEKLHLVVTEQGELKDVPKQLSSGGWSVNADGTVATLEGTLCEDAKSGRFEAVRFDFGCVELPTLIE